MALFRKKSDPISDRARRLNAEIAALEAQIKSLDGRLQQEQTQVRQRSAAAPPGLGATPSSPASPSLGPTREAHEPIFEEVDQGRLQARTEGSNTPGHYNELGVRKYDLLALFRRIKGHFRGPSTTNPKLVSYLAAGGIQGFRPLRYEKRVARNRFIVFAIFLLVVLLGLLAVYVRR